MLCTPPANGENNFAMRTVRLLLQIAVIAIGLIGIAAGFIAIQSIFSMPVPLLELLVAQVTEGIETGFAFPGQGVAPPVQVGHDLIPVMGARRQK
jgi:hypothetical protein